MGSSLRKKTERESPKIGRKILRVCNKEKW